MKQDNEEKCENKCENKCESNIKNQRVKTSVKK